MESTTLEMELLRREAVFQTMEKLSQREFLTYFLGGVIGTFTNEEWKRADLRHLVYHREDGPAVEFSNNIIGSRRWYLDDNYFNEENFSRTIMEVDSLDPALGLTDPREWVRKRFSKKLKEVV